MMQTDGTMDQHDAAGGDYSPWVADLVSGLCLWFCLFVLFVVVALAFLFVCLLLFKVLSLGGRPGQRLVLVALLVCLVLVGLVKKPVHYIPSNLNASLDNLATF